MRPLHLLLFGVLCVTGVATAADRFTLAKGGAMVIDRQTGLMWEQSPGLEHMGWMDAPAHCRDRTTGGQTQWRLPTKEELATLVDSQQADPALPSGHPFTNVKSAIYWTSTPDAKDPILAWHVSFFTGQVTVDGKHLNRRVWCVRTDQ